MDNYARGLRAAAKMIEEGTLDKMRKGRYAGFEESAIGKKFSAGKASLSELAEYAAANPEPQQRSAQCEKFESVFNAFALKG